MAIDDVLIITGNATAPAKTTASTSAVSAAGLITLCIAIPAVFLGGLWGAWKYKKELDEAMMEDEDGVINGVKRYMDAKLEEQEHKATAAKEAEEKRAARA